MIEKVNLLQQAAAIAQLFAYKRMGTLNQENTGGTYTEAPCAGSLSASSGCYFFGRNYAFFVISFVNTLLF